MPTPSRGAATNRPDTSPNAVAAVLRECAAAVEMYSRGFQSASSVRALADALEQTPVSDTALLGALSPGESVPMTWKDRVAIAALTCYGTSPAQVDGILRAAFPEMAPSDD